MRKSLNQVKFKGAMKVGHLVAVMRSGGDSLSPEQHRPMTGTCSVVESERTL